MKKISLALLSILLGGLFAGSSVIAKASDMDSTNNINYSSMDEDIKSDFIDLSVQDFSSGVRNMPTLQGMQFQKNFTGVSSLGIELINLRVSSPNSGGNEFTYTLIDEDGIEHEQTTRFMSTGWPTFADETIIFNDLNPNKKYNVKMTNPNQDEPANRLNFDIRFFNNI